MAASPQADWLLDEATRKMQEARALVHKPTLCPTCRHREARILERAERVRPRRVWLGRLLVTLLFLVLVALVWWRIGNPAAGVMLQEGGR